MEILNHLRSLRTILIMTILASMIVSAFSQFFHKKHKIYIDPDSDLGKIYAMNFEAEALLNIAQKIANHFQNKHIELKNIYHSGDNDLTPLKGKTFQELVATQMPSAKDAVWSVKFSEPEIEYGTEPYTCLAAIFYKNSAFIGTCPELLTNETDKFKDNPEEALKLAVRTSLGLEPDQYDHTKYDEYEENSNSKDSNDEDNDE